MTHEYSSGYLEQGGKRITWDQEFKDNLGDIGR